MKIKSLTILLLLSLTLATGCTVRGPSVKVDLPGVKFGVDGGGTHCPPAQAKKGRC